MYAFISGINNIDRSSGSFMYMAKTHISLLFGMGFVIKYDSHKSVWVDEDFIEAIML